MDVMLSAALAFLLPFVAVAQTGIASGVGELPLVTVQRDDMVMYESDQKYGNVEGVRKKLLQAHLGDDVVFAQEDAEVSNAYDVIEGKTPANQSENIRGSQSEGGGETSLGLEFVFIKGGCFRMGDEGIDAKPAHEVCLDDFYIGKYEVTQGQWVSIMGNNPSHFKNGDLYPVEQVSWHGVQKFIRKLNQKTSQNYRLPTEAEWEYAARSGGKSEKWAGTNEQEQLADYVWYGNNSGEQTHPVGRKMPNGLGIYDMTGNVWEWCSDYYGYDYYKESPRNNPKGPDRGNSRVLRGSSWSDALRILHVSKRRYYPPTFECNYLGFRLAKTP
ncbi:MAG: formylglycine-generating enzyme family protein [Candidatus Brocadiaceae bacterium]|nr:formylglycine-generating enzyme family protein [Candidatus Brocadiaceae bacterium]